MKKNFTESASPDSFSASKLALESEDSSLSPDTDERTESTSSPTTTSTTSGGDNPIINEKNDGVDDNSDNVSDTDKTSPPSSEESSTASSTSTATTTIEEQNILQEGEIKGLHDGENSTDTIENEVEDEPDIEPKNETQTDVVAPTLPPTLPSTLPPTLSPSSSPPPPKSKDSIEETPKTSTTTKTIDTLDQLPRPRSDSDLSPTARNFADTHCDLTNLKDEAWYPSGPEDSWQQRAPYLIVAGVWNAGVNQLTKALLKHPQIDLAKTDGFFLPKQFKKYYNIQSNDKTVGTKNETGSNFNVKVHAARERMYAQVYSKSTFREKNSNDEESPPAVMVDDDTKNSTKNQHVAMDVSPGLVFYAHKTSHSILCTAPWAKIVVLLRNPIDRLYRQWSYSVTHLHLNLSLEDWMAQEMKALQNSGVIRSSNETDKGQATSEAKEEMVVSEKDAWEKYQLVRTSGSIGRSLYVLQLEEWMDAFVSAGKTPSEEMIIITTEDIEENPEHEYAELVRFLGLTPLNDIPSINGDDGNDNVAVALGKSLQEKPDTTSMTRETRRMLRGFFKPYNKRLTQLLTSNGFEGDWYERWNK